MTNDDQIMQTRLDVAEMKGMLSQLVSSHEARLVEHNLRLDTHDSRLNEKSRTLARHDERIQDVEEDVAAVKNDDTARRGRNLSVSSLIVAVVVAVVTVVKTFIP